MNTNRESLGEGSSRKKPQLFLENRGDPGKKAMLFLLWAKFFKSRRVKKMGLVFSRWFLFFVPTLCYIVVILSLVLIFWR